MLLYLVRQGESEWNCFAKRRALGNAEEIGANGNSLKHHQDTSVLEGVEP